MKTKRRKPGTGRGQIDPLYYATPQDRAAFVRALRSKAWRAMIKVAVAA